MDVQRAEFFFLNKLTNIKAYPVKILELQLIAGSLWDPNLNCLIVINLRVLCSCFAQSLGEGGYHGVSAS